MMPWAADVAVAPAEAAVVPVASPDEVWDMAAGRGALTWLDSRPTIYRKLDACIELCKQNGDRCASAHARSRSASQSRRARPICSTHPRTTHLVHTSTCQPADPTAACPTRPCV